MRLIKTLDLREKDLSNPLNKLEVESKINEVVNRVNEICLKLFPSAQPVKENKGYENEEITDHKIPDPFDK
jgi:hypothetical protein